MWGPYPPLPSTPLIASLLAPLLCIRVVPFHSAIASAPCCSGFAKRRECPAVGGRGTVLRTGNANSFFVDEKIAQSNFSQIHPKPWDFLSRIPHQVFRTGSVWPSS